MKIHVKIALILWVILVHVMLAGGAYLYMKGPKEIVKPGPIRYVEKPKYLKKVERVLVPSEGRRIEYFSKEKLAKEMDLPELKNLDGGVVAVGMVEAHEGKTTVLGTLDAGADDVLRGDLVYRQEPPPFFSFRHDFRVEALWFPVGTNIIESNFIATPLRTGPIYWTAKIGFGVDEDSNIEGHIGVGVQYRFGGRR